MKWFDRVRETTVTEGTGTLTLDAAVRSHRRFSAALSVGDVIAYCIAHRAQDQWEVGLGTIGAAETLERTKVLAGSNGASAVNLSAGTKDVFLTHPAAVVDGGWRCKTPCRAATTGNVTISTALNNGDTIDGVTLATGDRVLVCQQSTASQNGIYVVGASPERAADLYAGAKASGSLVLVTSGTANAGRLFVCTSAAGSDIAGTDSLTWAGLMGGSAAGAGTDNHVVRWDGTAALQDSGLSISDADVLKAFASYSPMATLTSGTTVEIDLQDDNIHLLTLGHNATLEIANATVGQRWALRLKQDGTGSRALTWFPNIYWPGGTVPTVTLTAGRWDWYGFICTGLDDYGDPVFDGFVLGKNFGA